MAITAVMIPDTMTILTPIRPDPRPSIAGTASRDTNRTTRVREPISDTMVNGIPARNKDPNKKAADLAAFFTTSLFSSDQHLHSNHRRRQMIPAMNWGGDASKRALLKAKDIEMFAKPKPETRPLKKSPIPLRAYVSSKAAKKPRKKIAK
jgi:hypothetical protein